MRTTAKTHLNNIHEAAVEAPNAITVKIDGTIFTLTGAYIGLVNTEDKAALIIKDQTLILDLDRRGSFKNAKIIDEPDYKAVAKELLPTPEPPKEAQDALDLLLKTSGFKLVIDAKGKPSLVPVDTVTTATGEPRKRAPKGSLPPKVTKPAIVKGLIVTHNKTGFKYQVSGVDTVTGDVKFNPLDGGQEDYHTKALRGNGSTQVVPAFWRYHAEVA